MSLPKVVVFDLFDTILRTDSFSFDSGLDYLYNNFLEKGISRNLLKEAAKDQEYLFEERKVTHKEVKFTDELIFFKNKLGFNSTLSLDEIEYETMLAMGKETLIDGAFDLIKFYKELNIPMYILSNSIFSTNALKRYLKSFGILEYFNNVYSSSDFGYRKPHISFFNMLINEIQKEYPNINKKEIYFIGNDYQTDVRGSSNAGLVPIWYNIDNKENVDKIDCKIINTFSDLIDIYL